MITRIAAFNVENLFARAKVLNSPDGRTRQEVLAAHAEVNELLGRPAYSPADQARILELLDALGLLQGGQGPFARLQSIRGQLLRKPRNGPPKIVAAGRGDWVGWVELLREPVNAVAMDNTARVIRDVGAHVLAIVEAESRPVLKEFHDMLLPRVGVAPGDGYRHFMLIDGNDERGIDVGLATRAGYPIGAMRSHIDLLDARGRPVFSRDCPEYAVATPSGETLLVLPNHFKSKFGGNDARSKARRRAQAEATAAIYRRLCDEGFEHVVVLGDLNDTPDSPELAPLLQDTDLRDVSESPRFTEFEYRATSGGRGIGTFGLGNDKEKIDYLLLSPALFGRVTAGGLFRKGAWPGSRPPRWEVYPELKEEAHAASDHHAIWADLEI